MIQKYITTFLKSKEPFNVKKGVLVEAQVISNKYNLGHLLYADSKINSAYYFEFNYISKSEKDLKKHLKKVIDKIKLIKPISKQDTSIINNKLQIARANLIKSGKYEMISEKPEVKSYSLLTLGLGVLEPENYISEYYKVLGDFYVSNSNIDGFKKDELIPVKKAKEQRFKNENFVFNLKAILIQDKLSNQLYLVTPGFIDKNTINKKYSQYKFKG